MEINLVPKTYLDTIPNNELAIVNVQNHISIFNTQFGSLIVKVNVKNWGNVLGYLGAGNSTTNELVLGTLIQEVVLKYFLIGKCISQLASGRPRGFVVMPLEKVVNLTRRSHVQTWHNLR